MESILCDIIKILASPEIICDNVKKIKDSETLKILIKTFPSILETDKYGYNLLHRCIKNSNLEIITYLVENYHNLNTGENILFKVIHNKNVNCVKYLFKKFPYLILNRDTVDSDRYNIVTLSFLCEKKVINYLMQTVPDLYLKQIKNIVHLSRNGRGYVCLDGNEEKIVPDWNIRNLYPIFSKIPELIKNENIRETLIPHSNILRIGKNKNRYRKSIFSENTLILPLTFQIDN